MEYLLCARFSIRPWGSTVNKSQMSHPPTLHSSWEDRWYLRKEINKIKKKEINKIILFVVVL